MNGKRGFVRALRLKRDKVPSFDEYPFSIPIIRGLDRLELHPSVTFFIGENGSGKSTLIEALAVKTGFNPEGGSWNFNFATRESHSCLSRYLVLERSLERPSDGFFLRAESFFNVASEIERLYVGDERDERARKATYGTAQMHEQSHGESFFALLMNRLSGDGLYIFDEPESALSPQRQMSLLVLLHDLVAKGSQFVIATHSPIIMAYPDAWIYQMSSQEIQRVSYTETEHFQVTRDFLNLHEQMLSILLKPGEK